MNIKNWRLCRSKKEVPLFKNVDVKEGHFQSSRLTGVSTGKLILPDFQY